MLPIMVYCFAYLHTKYCLLIRLQPFIYTYGFHVHLVNYISSLLLLSTSGTIITNTLLYYRLVQSLLNVVDLTYQPFIFAFLYNIIGLLQSNYQIILLIRNLEGIEQDHRSSVIAEPVQAPTLLFYTSSQSQYW